MVEVEISKYNGTYFLWIDKQLWMWDIPLEIKLQKALAKKAYGDVLVTGYGLGLVQKFLLENNQVESILTIELYKDVVKENKKYFKTIYGDIEYCDFNKYHTKRKFDCIIGDIWAEIDLDCLDEYVQFKNKASTLIKSNGKILAWGQNYFEYLLN